jgi:hypothetical protein
MRKTTMTPRTLAEAEFLGRCDCEDIVRHSDGGNYHPVAVVQLLEDGDFAITFTTTRMTFGSDEWERLPCGHEIRVGDTHAHVPLHWMAEALLKEWLREEVDLTPLLRRTYT